MPIREVVPRQGHTDQGRDNVAGKNFVFICWWCEEDCLVWGEQAGFWGTTYRVDTQWHCWCCGALNETADPPWTEAD
jgi:hypothetical protein